MLAKNEKYASSKSKMKHEKSEGSKERKMEYGKKAVKKVAKKAVKKSSASDMKMAKIMHEWKMGTLHSGKGPKGPKKGPVVKSQRQAVAIAMSQSRKSGRGR
jgi:hypothetical protein